MSATDSWTGSFEICLEKTNFRYLTREELTQEGKLPVPDFASCDVSFISLSKILPAAFEIIKPGAEMVCLIKPQFEAGREKVGKKGVVRDPAFPTRPHRDSRRWG